MEQVNTHHDRLVIPVPGIAFLYSRTYLDTLAKRKILFLAGNRISVMVSSRLTTATVRVPTQVKSCGICGRQIGTGAGFLRVLRFPLPILITPTAPHSSSSIIRGWYNRWVSGRRNKWTQSHPTPRNLKKKQLICHHIRSQSLYRLWYHDTHTVNACIHIFLRA
jgi:hypothetical protein